LGKRGNEKEAEKGETVREEKPNQKTHDPTQSSYSPEQSSSFTQVPGTWCLSSSIASQKSGEANKNQLERHEKMTRIDGRIVRMLTDVFRMWFVDESVQRESNP